MKWLQIIIRRLRLGLATMLWGVTGFSSELGKQIKKISPTPH
jgi:hypothetical protein